MKCYIQFMEQRIDRSADGLHIELVEGKLQRASGLDSVLVLDGRRSLESMAKVARKRAHRLRKVQPSYIGFQIVAGQRLNGADPVLLERKLVSHCDSYGATHVRMGSSIFKSGARE